MFTSSSPQPSTTFSSTAVTLAPLPNPPTPARPLRILLATTGSVASIKAPLIVGELLSYENVELQVIATRRSLRFYERGEVEKMGVRVWRDEDEWELWDKVSDPILHIELRRWTDLVLIAPCSANTLSKLSVGACDNLLTSLLRALDASLTRVLVFPAMNTHMYAHPLTQPQLAVLRDTLGYEVVGPVSKGLACGDTGVGAMTEWKEIVRMVEERYGLRKKRVQGAMQGRMRG